MNEEQAAIKAGIIPAIDAKKIPNILEKMYRRVAVVTVTFPEGRGRSGRFIRSISTSRISLMMFPPAPISAAETPVITPKYSVAWFNSPFSAISTEMKPVTSVIKKFTGLNRVNSFNLAKNEKN